MTDLQRRMMEKLGLTEENFKPKKNQIQRLNEAEESIKKAEENIEELQSTSDDMVLMMADLIGGE